MKEYIVREYEPKDYINVEKNMTLNDVIDCLRYIDRGYVPNYSYTGDEGDFERCKLHMAIDKAIKIIKNKIESEGLQ